MEIKRKVVVIDLAVKDYMLTSTSNNELASIVIVNYNSGELLLNTIKSIINSTYPYIEIIIIDNSSKDNSIDLSIDYLRKNRDKLLGSLYRRIVFIMLDRNYGFSGGGYLGAIIARGKYIFISNPDIIVDPRTIEIMIYFARKLKKSIISPLVLLMDRKNIINTKGMDIHYAGFGLLREVGKHYDPSSDNIELIMAPHGSFFLVPRQILEETRGFDPAYMLFNEDTDLGWRAWMHGYPTIYVPYAIIYHKWGYSTGKLSPSKLYLLERNRMIMILSNYTLKELVYLTPILLVVEIATFTYLLVNGSAHIKIKAYADIIRNANYISRRKNKIKRRIPSILLLRYMKSTINHVYFKENYLKALNKILRLIAKLILAEK